MVIKDPRVLGIRNQKVLGLNTFIMTQARVESTSLIITGVGKAAYWVQGLRPWCSSRSPQSLNPYNIHVASFSCITSYMVRYRCINEIKIEVLIILLKYIVIPFLLYKTIR